MGFLLFKARQINMRNRTKIKGFTLIELMMAIAIIAVLAAIAIPTYTNTIKRAYVADGLSLSSSVKFAVYEYFYFQDQWPTDNDAANLETANAITSQAVKSITVSNGDIIIMYNRRVLDNATIILSPSVSGGTISWDCTTGTVPQALRPPECHP